MWIDRLQELPLRSLVDSRPVVVVTGARQTGKTSLVRRLFGHYHYVSLDLPSEAEQAETAAKLFLERHPAPVIIDEIQYAPSLLRRIKMAVDADRGSNGRFILTGSQPFELMRGITESLAGRSGLLHLEGLTWGEVEKSTRRLSPVNYLLRGGFPELYEKPEMDARSFYQAYVATYLERDLRSQLKVGRLYDFERFLRACALRTSQVLNRAELARDVGISPSTAGEWLSVLERSGLVALLEPWFSNATKSLVKSPKLHFLDTGLCGFLMGMTDRSDLLASPLGGALWETAVFCELRRLSGLCGGWQLYYWRDRTKEADFLLHKAGRFRLADAKWSEHPANAGSIGRVLKELPEGTAASIFCRTEAEFKLGGDVRVRSLEHVPDFLEG